MKVDFAGFSVFDDRQLRLETAARSVVAACREDRFGRGWRPKGIDETAIVLESLGYSSEVVAELWYDSLFELAHDVNELVEKYISDGPAPATDEPHWFMRACKDYAVGALYSGPFIVAILGMAAFGAALWSSISTPEHLATAIALGVYAALVVSGIFSQVIGRRVVSYVLQDNYRLTTWFLDRTLALAVGVFALLGLLGWLALRPFYGEQDAGLAASFFFGAGLFQVALAPLYALRRLLWILWISVATTALTGATFVLSFHRRIVLPTEPATLAAELAVAGLLTIVGTLWWLRRRIGRTHGRILPPSRRAVVRDSLPYAIFGAGYFLMIIVDHVAAGLHNGLPYAYRATYELGTDLALLAIVPVVGVINVVLEVLPRRILAGSRLRIAEISPFDRHMKRYFLAAAAAVVGATLLAALLAATLGHVLLRHVGLAGAPAPATLFVIRYAAVADGMLMLGLLSSQLLFIVNQPRIPVLAAVLGVAVNLTIGIVVDAARLPVGWCVFGLDAGVAAFVVLTTVAAYRTMSRFTYAYYAAY